MDDLAGHPGRSRPFSGAVPVELTVVDTVVDGVMTVEGTLTGTVDGVDARFVAAAPLNATCVRCLTSWTDIMEVSGSQHFSKVPDEDGYAIERGEIDLAGPAIDELALGIPLSPLCRPDCKGLCPICGTDLNTDPCDGHGDDSDSPFAALKDLFDH